MDRRSFLKGLATAAGLTAIRPVAALDQLAFIATTPIAPARAAIDFGVINKIMKRHYLPAMVEHLNTENPLLARLRHGS